MSKVTKKEKKIWITPKVTPLKKKEIKNLKKIDVLARYLNEYLNRDNSIHQSMLNVFNEITAFENINYVDDNKKLANNIMRSIKRLFTKWKSLCKCTKILQDKFIKELNRPFPIKMYTRSLYKKSSIDKNSMQVSSDEEENIDKDEEDDDDEKEDMDDIVKFQNRTKKKMTKIITPQLSSALDNSKTSNRNAVNILAATCKSLNMDLKSINLNRESIRLNRNNERQNTATEVKKDFSPTSMLTVHWDTKMMEDISTKKKIERLAVSVTGENVIKLLGIPKLLNATGESQAKAVVELINEWKLADKIVSMCFDTTASNTGVRNGACKIIEDILGKPLFSLACRHHIMELILSHVFKVSLLSL